MNTLYAFTSLPSQLKSRQANPKYTKSAFRQSYMVIGEVYEVLEEAVEQLAKQNQVCFIFISVAACGRSCERVVLGIFIENRILYYWYE